MQHTHSKRRQPETPKSENRPSQPGAVIYLFPEIQVELNGVEMQCKADGTVHLHFYCENQKLHRFSPRAQNSAALLHIDYINLRSNVILVRVIYVSLHVIANPSILPQFELFSEYTAWRQAPMLLLAIDAPRLCDAIMHFSAPCVSCNDLPRV